MTRSFLSPCVLVLLSLPVLSNAQTPTDSIMASCFGDHEGTFVLYDAQTGQATVHNDARSRRRFSPFSTFKIPNSLIALETGIVTDVDAPIAVDTAAYPPEEWWMPEWMGVNTLRSSMKYSVVPVYRTIAKRIGVERMQAYIDRFDYGNRDISSGLDEFWLGGSILISAHEQIEFLRRFHEGRLGVGKRATEKVKDILVRETTATYRLSAKTGTGTAGGRGLGWYVGYVEREKGVTYFAMNCDGKDFEDAREARTRIAAAVLHALGLTR